MQASASLLLSAHLCRKDRAEKPAKKMLMYRSGGSSCLLIKRKYYRMARTTIPVLVIYEFEPLPAIGSSYQQLNIFINIVCVCVVYLR
jgi:hypothetical protein